MSHVVARCSLAVDERPRAAGCAEFVLILLQVPQDIL